MTDRSPFDAVDSPASDNGNPRPTPTWLTKVLLPFAAVVFVFREPAVWLSEKVYQSQVGPLWRMLGSLAALAAGIATGYTLGWQHEVSTVKWLAVSLLAVAVTYFYAWPLLVHLLINKLFQTSEWLWNRVNIDGWRDRHNPAWFTRLLLFATGAASVAFAGFVGYQILFGIHDQLNWGAIGYLPGAAAALVMTIIVGAILICVLVQGKIAYCALVSGIAVVYFASALTETYLPAVFGVKIHTVTNLLLLVLWLAYIFPLLHILISNGLRWFGETMEKLLNAVYEEAEGGYREFFLQFTNVVVAIGTFIVALHFSPLVANGAWLCYTVTALATLASYVLVGKLLDHTGSSLIGLATAIFSGWQTFLWFAGVGFWGTAAGVLAGAVAVVAVFFLAYPVCHLFVRLFAQPLLASWLREPLVNLHTAISDELFHAYDNTYSDTTPYRIAFAQVINVAVAVGTFYGALLLADALELASGFGYILAASLTLGAYLGVGKLLEAKGNKLPGTIVSLAVGLYAGAQVHALNTHVVGHFDFNALWSSVPAGAVAALATYWVGFTITYVVIRAFANAVKGTWLLTLTLVGLFKAYEKICSVGWAAFVRAYNDIRDSFRPLYADVKRSWNEAVATFRRK